MPILAPDAGVISGVVRSNSWALSLLRPHAMPETAVPHWPETQAATRRPSTSGGSAKSNAADVPVVSGAVKADIGGDEFVLEQRVQFCRSRAVVIGSARRKGAKEFGLELRRGRHAIDSLR